MMLQKRVLTAILSALMLLNLSPFSNSDKDISQILYEYSKTESKIDNSTDTVTQSPVNSNEDNFQLKLDMNIRAQFE